MSRSYEIKPRLGGGFVLTMFEDGEEMGRGYYPLPRLSSPLVVDEVHLVTKALFAEAQSDGESWVSLVREADTGSSPVNG